jgi:hypothetical protein
MKMLPNFEVIFQNAKKYGVDHVKRPPPTKHLSTTYELFSEHRAFNKWARDNYVGIFPGRGNNFSSRVIPIPEYGSDTLRYGRAMIRAFKQMNIHKIWIRRCDTKPIIIGKFEESPGIKLDLTGVTISKFSLECHNRLRRNRARIRRLKKPGNA